MSCLTLRVALIDHSAIQEWPHRHIAAADMHRQLDPHYRLRQIMGASLAPPRFRVFPLGEGRVLVVGLEAAACQAAEAGP